MTIHTHYTTHLHNIIQKQAEKEKEKKIWINKYFFWLFICLAFRHQHISFVLFFFVSVFCFINIFCFFLSVIIIICKYSFWLLWWSPILLPIDFGRFFLEYSKNKNILPDFSLSLFLSSIIEYIWPKPIHYYYYLRVIIYWLGNRSIFSK